MSLLAVVAMHIAGTVAAEALSRSPPGHPHAVWRVTRIPRVRKNNVANQP